jgi:D-alanyl-D-alanine carboxypeptidase
VHRPVINPIGLALTAGALAAIAFAASCSTSSDEVLIDDARTAVSVEPSASTVGSTSTTRPGATSTTEPATPSTTQPDASFPAALFAAISVDPVSEKVAEQFSAILNDMAEGSGVAATVMSADGTWSGAAGKADGVQDVEVDSQFAIASITKTVIAAQVMQMVEAGELGLDDLAEDHLPADLDFDSNGATIRQLLGMRSGIPDYDSIFDSLATDRQHRWTPTEVLALVAADRSSVGEFFEYSTTNYVLLGLIIEQVRGRAVVDVLRDGVLGAVEGMERLIYQPDEVPTEPMAMPGGESSAAVEDGGGYLPSLAGATAGGPGGGMSSDSPTLGRWWRAFCAGEIVSVASLTEMATFDDGYGLGLYEIADLGLDEIAEPYGSGVGHAGEHIGFVSMAACLPADGLVVVVLSNGVVDIGAIAIALADGARST